MMDIINLYGKIDLNKNFQIQKSIFQKMDLDYFHQSI